MMDVNPYDAPQDTDVDVGRGTGRVWRLLARLVFNATVVVAFMGFVVGCISLFYHGYPWHVAVGVVLIAMIAIAFAGKTWTERATLSLTVPFLALGGVAGFFIYFWMFSFSWFEAVFNGKERGPLGLLIFVCGFALGIGLAACWCIHRLLGFFAVRLQGGRSE